MSDPMNLSAMAGLMRPWSLGPAEPAGSRLDLRVSPEGLLAATAELARSQWGYLSAITGRDNGAAESAPGTAEQFAAGAPPAPGTVIPGTMEVLYHFCRGPSVLTFRLTVPRDAPRVPSIHVAVPSALLYEKEIVETFGIEVSGLPDNRRQFLADDWPPGLYPMRKDFDAAKKVPYGGPGAGPEAAAETPPGTFIVPIGPQHPALKEPGHFELAVDGEIVTAASIRLGYVHRGIEKGAEVRSWVQNIYLMERICGICSHIHATAYVLGVEKLAGVQIPPRAKAIRTLFCELERVHSHLLWLGVAAHQAGFDTLFMFSWRDRETVMSLLEELSGNRVNYSVNLLGGVKYDIDAAGADAIRRGLDYLEERSRHYLTVVTTDESFLRRTRGVGAITFDQANRLGTVGPTARASGVARDIRVDAPYLSYDEHPVKSIIDERCDLEARFVVRITELFESYRLIRELLDTMPPGELAIPVPRRVPEGEVVSRVEAPRGELFYYIRSTGGTQPDRVKVRTPSLCNWAAVLSVAVGHKLADIPMIMAGIDPCFSCNDRSILLRRPGGAEEWTWEDLRRHGIRYYGGEA
jgi:ech hydrogenase subunit E